MKLKKQHRGATLERSRPDTGDNEKAGEESRKKGPLVRSSSQQWRVGLKKAGASVRKSRKHSSTLASTL